MEPSQYLKVKKLGENDCCLGLNQIYPTGMSIAELSFANDFQQLKKNKKKTTRLSQNKFFFSQIKDIYINICFVLFCDRSNFKVRYSLELIYTELLQYHIVPGNLHLVCAKNVLVRLLELSVFLLFRFVLFVKERLFSWNNAQSKTWECSFYFILP